MEKLPSRVLRGTPIYDASGSQKYKITKLLRALGEREPIEEKSMSIGEAGRLIRELYSRLRAKKSRKY